MQHTVKEARETTIFYINREELKIETDSLYNFVIESEDETTTPRGIGPRDFIEEIETGFDVDEAIEDTHLNVEDYDTYEEFKKDVLFEKAREIQSELLLNRFLTIDNFSFDKKNNYYQLNFWTISTWGVGGNNYKRGTDFYPTEEEAEDALFDKTYEYDFCNDDQRDTRYFMNYEQAKEELIDSLANDWVVDVDVAKSIYSKMQKLEELKQDRLEREKQEIENRKERVKSIANQYAIIEPKKETFKETATRLSEALKSKIEKDVFWEAVKIVRSKFKFQ